MYLYNFIQYLKKKYKKKIHVDDDSLLYEVSLENKIIAYQFGHKKPFYDYIKKHEKQN
jgi:hypothetical protein